MRRHFSIRFFALGISLIMLICPLCACSNQQQTREFVDMSALDSYTQYLASALVTDCKSFADTLAAAASSSKYFAGSDTANAVADLIAEQMRRIGLDSVTEIGSRVDKITVNSATLSREGVSYNITAYPTAGATTVTSEIYDLGDGNESEFGQQAPGKIALAIAENTDFIPYIVKQAQLHGVGALLIARAGGGYDTDTESALRFTGCTIPVFSISESDARKLLDEAAAAKKQSVEYTLTADTAITPSIGKNIVGYIEGYDTQSSIVITAAYDGLLFGYNSNACAVAAMLEMADALKKIGLRPRCNVYFAACCGSQIGSASSIYSENSGIYSLLNADALGWAENARLHIDVSLPSVQADDEAVLNVSAGLENWIGGLAADFDGTPYTNVNVSSLVNARSAGYVFENFGVPTVGISGGYEPEIIYSDADTASLYDAQSLRFSLKIYGRVLCSALDSALIPYDFENCFSPVTAVFEQYDAEILTTLGATATAAQEKADAGALTAVRLHTAVEKLNALYQKAVSERDYQRARRLYDDCAEISDALSAEFRRIHNGMFGFDYDNNEDYGYAIALKNAVLMQTALENAQSGRNTVAVDRMLSQIGGLRFCAISSADAVGSVYAQTYPAGITEAAWSRGGIYRLPDIGRSVCLLSENRKEDFTHEAIIASLAALTDGAKQTAALLDNALSAYRTAAGVFGSEGFELAKRCEELEKDYK